MSAVTDKIRTRGYWRFIIRPVTFVADRIPFADLEDIVRRNAVRFRGWDFPHLDKDGLAYGTDFVGSETDWAHHVEAWRAYQSGLFVHLSGFDLDWTDQSWIGKSSGLPADGHPVLGVTDAIWTITEATEFAARLAPTAAGDEHMLIVVEVGGVEGRELYVDETFRAPLYHTYRARVPSFAHEQTVRRDELLADPDDVARRSVLEVFLRFGWRASPDIVREVQLQLRSL